MLSQADKALIISIFTWTASGLRSTLESMAIPSSVKA